MAQVTGIGPDTRPDHTIYDPACGSGSLLLKAADEAPHGISIYGQEMDNATWALARMNMILHGYETADLWRGNTLAAPYFKHLAGRVKVLEERYARPLPELERDVAAFAEKVEGRLKRMGLTWA